MKLSRYLLIGLLGLSLSACSLPGFDFGASSSTSENPTSEQQSESQTPTQSKESEEENVQVDIYYLANKVLTTRKYEVQIVMGETNSGHFSYFAQDGNKYHIQQTFPAENAVSDYYCSYDGTTLHVVQKINGETTQTYDCVEGDGYFEWFGGNYVTNGGIMMTGMPATLDFFPLIENRGLNEVDGGYTFMNTTFSGNGETFVEVSNHKFTLSFYDSSAGCESLYIFHNIGTTSLDF